MQNKKGEIISSRCSLFPKNKKAQGLSTNAIIVIVLGIAVMAFLILGFTLGWNKLLPFLSSSNVETIVNQCSVACATSSKFDYCSSERTLDDGETKIISNCATFSVIAEYDKYGIDECPAIDCNMECVDSMGGEIKDLCSEEEDDVSSVASVSGGQRCCVLKATQ